MRKVFWNVESKDVMILGLGGYYSRDRGEKIISFSCYREGVFFR